MNEKYQKRYERQKQLGFWVNDFFGVFAQAHLENMFKKPFSADLDRAHKELFPRRKAIKHENLPEAVVNEVRAKWIPRALARWEREKKLYAGLTKWLNENAHRVVLENYWQVTYKQETYTYSTQTNPMGYAHGDVKRKAKKLDRAKVPYEIRVFGIDSSGKMFFSEDREPNFRFGGKNWADKEKGYALYAPLAPYQLDAIERTENESLLELAIACWENGQNPKVPYPFLPDEIYEKSMKVVYG